LSTSSVALMKRIPRSTPTIIIGLAVVLLLTTTGGAVAGGLITGKKIKDGTVTSADIKDKTVTSKDLAASALAATGATGPAGPIGATGTTGAPGAAGATGVPGAAGAAGARGFSAWDVIPSGTTVTGSVMWDGGTTGAASTDLIGIDLPGIAPVALTDGTVNFKAGTNIGDADATCTGSAAVPTAPSGMVCLYTDGSGGVTDIRGYANTLSKRSFYVAWDPSNTAGLDEFVYATWAYTAP
jgi:hypothetical protein